MYSPDARSSNGRTAAFEAVNAGSIPALATRIKRSSSSGPGRGLLLLSGWLDVYEERAACRAVVLRGQDGSIPSPLTTHHSPLTTHHFIPPPTFGV